MIVIEAPLQLRDRVAEPGPVSSVLIQQDSSSTTHDYATIQYSQAEGDDTVDAEYKIITTALHAYYDFDPHHPIVDEYHPSAGPYVDALLRPPCG